MRQHGTLKYSHKISEHDIALYTGMEMPAAARMRVRTSVSVPVLFARWLDFPPVRGVCHCVLTVGAGFVNKVTEVEQGGPGGQVLNEPLRKRLKQQRTVSVVSQAAERFSPTFCPCVRFGA